MKEDFRINCEPRPLFTKIVERKLSAIEATRDPSAKAQAKTKLFTKLSMIHCRSLIRMQRIRDVKSDAVSFTRKTGDREQGLEMFMGGMDRAYARNQNVPTYEYVLETMQKLRKPALA